ncbi:MAG: arginine repressor [Clostridia bacterium]|jgi:transcriptional regulator of arginine metabolism|nr:arginine repressor [Clostridia bacterium]
MLRNARHSKILEIIAEKEIETQEELCEELNASNFSVTQATISRDIKELHLFKVAGINKRFRYTCINESEGELSEKMRSLFQACVLDIRPVGNLIVIKTLNGNGANAGVVIDRLNYKEVVGCVAGDDTTLLICETAEESWAVRERLNKIIQG